MRFQILESITPYINSAFKAFYNELLSNEAFSSYFESREQIDQLLQKQKMNFIDSLKDEDKIFEMRFYKLGEMHYHIGIPYEAFISGAKILNREFVSLVVSNKMDSNIILSLNDYFEASIEFMAKGYLNTFIDSDRKHIDKIIEAIKSTDSERERIILVEHYEWLIQLFDAIKAGKKEDAPNLDIDKSTVYLALKQFEQDGKNIIGGGFEIGDIRKMYGRIYNSSRNIFYFIERNIYTEALSIFVSLLEIYKFTLMFSNIITTAMTARMEAIIQHNIRVADEDALTGVLNRRKLDQILDYGLDDSRGRDTSISVIMIDIDHFKSINDNYGHAKGDFVLKQFATVVKKSLRKNDILFRYGGEEFLIICFDTELNGAKRFAERLRVNIEEFIFEGLSGVTASFGVATFDGEESGENLIRRADEKLYLSKREGRNRVS